tara:strand:+ start:453 stop:587 length:135 start_codon:yes stop_codon:yes gene_type:complete
MTQKEKEIIMNQFLLNGGGFMLHKGNISPIEMKNKLNKIKDKIK